MAATGEGSGRSDKRTGGARPPTIELTATEVGDQAPAGKAGATADPAAPSSAGDKPAPSGSTTARKDPAAPAPAAAAATSTGSAGAPPKPAETAKSPDSAKSPEVSKSPDVSKSTGAAQSPAAAKTGEAGKATEAGKSADTSKTADAGKTASTVTDASSKPAAKPAGATPSTGPQAGATKPAGGDAGTRATTGDTAAAGTARAPGTAVPPATPAAQPARRGIGVMGLVAAALIGGVVGLAGALAVTHYGIIPATGGTDNGTSELADRVDALAAAVSAAPASDPDAAAALRQAVADLGERVDALAAAAVPPTDAAGLSDRLTALEQKVATTTPGAGGPDATALQASVTALGDRVDGLSGEVEALKNAPAAPAGADPDALAALEQRVSTLDTQLGDRISKVDQTASEQLSALGDSLGGRLDGVEQKLETLAGLGDTVSALQGARDETASTVAALGDRLGKLEAVDQTEAARAPAAIAFATVRLGEAVSSGRPYAAELAALRPRLGDSEDVKTLAATAETGVPTRASIAAMLALEKPAMLAAATPAPAAPAEPGPFEALLSGAQSLVSIRPTGPESGDPVATGLQDITAALAAGDLAAAQKAFDALPESARAAAPRFAAALAERRAAETAFAGLEATVLARLDGATE